MMAERTVSLKKPHIFKGRDLWYCCMRGYMIGSGQTPKEAYECWVSRKVWA